MNSATDSGFANNVHSLQREVDDGKSQLLRRKSATDELFALWTDSRGQRTYDAYCDPAVEAETRMLGSTDELGLGLQAVLGVIRESSARILEVDQLAGQCSRLMGEQADKVEQFYSDFDRFGRIANSAERRLEDVQRDIEAALRYHQHVSDADLLAILGLALMVGGMFLPPLVTIPLVGPLTLNIGITGVSFGVPVCGVGGFELGVGINVRPTLSRGLKSEPSATLTASDVAVDPPCLFG